MPTIGEWKKAQANRYAEETQALVNVLQERMMWHLQQFESVNDALMKRVHEELFKRDQDTLDDLQEKYDQQRKVFQTRHKLDIPALKVKE
jgi:hypothetical protein